MEKFQIMLILRLVIYYISLFFDLIMFRFNLNEGDIKITEKLFDFFFLNFFFFPKIKFKFLVISFVLNWQNGKHSELEKENNWNICSKHVLSIFFNSHFNVLNKKYIYSKNRLTVFFCFVFSWFFACRNKKSLKHRAHLKKLRYF